MKQNEKLYIEIWKKKVSQTQLLKFLPSTTSVMFKQLSADVDGYTCLQYFARLKQYYHEKDETNFLHTVRRLCVYLEQHSTLLAGFPPQILTNLRNLKQPGEEENKNVIFLTKQHQIYCSGCEKFVAGNKTKQVVCLCSTTFYDEDCYKRVSKKCRTCGYFSG
jgi:hypothetical protein